ncbi:T-cell ecto-ADP-ribosyltransferase 2-like [Paramisgurnus dabryanus]|uniref:T-cell ecto-ADP-ribosyltransferase 2-like n=1 Tax=Paramisgurnus dabryanus TaxID=90735 RepID=UPI003CCF8F8D
MLTIAAFILIVTSKVVLGQDDRWADEEEIYQLDMAVKSVDDQYVNCTKEMETQVEEEYLKNEIKADKVFGEEWKKGGGEYLEPQENLTRNNLIAIFVYTGSKVSGLFNVDVLFGKEKYLNDKFTWYSLHFLLTQAIQTLKITNCTLTYRCTRDKFDENVLNKEIRFGFFASSSLVRKAKVFGNVSCFKINTCYGANLTNYSQKPHEQEILIPPYEKFNVTAIKKENWCETVFVLESTGIESNLTCAKVPKKERNQYRRQGTGFQLL